MFRNLLALSLLLLAPLMRAAEVRVFAAASLTDALQEIAENYEQRSTDRVVFNFAASSVLARQIEAGAPADLFFSADENRMNELARQRLIVPSTRVSILSNTLAVVVPFDSPVRLTSPRQLVSLRSIALAEPSSVPAGIYARLYLQKAGVWNAIAPKVIPTANVRGALAAVAAGNADAAIVYRTDAAVSREVRVAFEVPPSAGPTISYSLAAIAGSEDTAAARRFLAYLRSPQSLAVFARYGFIVR